MADITFLSAPIGGGKSLYATRAICKELKRSNRMIVTNVPVFLGDAPEGMMSLQEWCHEYVQDPIDVSKRVRVLTHEEVFEFWRYYPGGIKLDNKDIIRPGRDYETVPDLESRIQMTNDGHMPRGCFFVIDEVHLHFGARDWAKIGNKVEHYMSQLRKLDDDLWLITQHPEKVDKNFRRNATEWIYLQNMSKTRLFGGVSLKGRFRVYTYPNMPSRGDSPTTKAWMQLEDENFHRCYNTMAGVGLSGKLSPETSRFKGRHWSVWLVMLLLLGVAAWYIPHWGMSLVGAGIKRGINGLESSVAGVGLPGHPVALQARTNAVVQVSQVVSAPTPATHIDDVLVSGVIHLPSDKWMVTLTDGRVITSDDIRFERITPDAVRYDGRVYYRASYDQLQERRKPIRKGGSTEKIF